MFSEDINMLNLKAAVKNTLLLWNIIRITSHKYLGLAARLHACIEKSPRVQIVFHSVKSDRHIYGAGTQKRPGSDLAFLMLYL